MRMNPLTRALAATLAAPGTTLLADLEEICKDRHRHPQP
jgi:hypothetical protein